MTSQQTRTPPHDLGDGVEMRGLCDSRYFEMTARSNGTAYRIFVGGSGMVLVGDRPQATRHPVIYVLDGKLNFAMVHAQVQTMCALGQLPPAYVVGIGYAGDGGFFEKDVLLRQGDLTPNAGGELEADVKAMNQASGVVLGGAGAFLDFLQDELRPTLEATFAIDPGDATLLGNSLGGLFPSWVLLHQPELFQRYVIVSPSWWWNDYEVWRWEADYAAGHHDLPARVFAAFGGLETAEKHRAIAVKTLQTAEGEVKASLERTMARADQHGWMRGAELIPQFRETLEGRGYPGLDLTALVLPEETHESIPGVGFSRGLRAVFGAWKPAGPRQG